MAHHRHCHYYHWTDQSLLRSTLHRLMHSCSPGKTSHSQYMCRPLCVGVCQGLFYCLHLRHKVRLQLQSWHLCQDIMVRCHHLGQYFDLGQIKFLIVPIKFLLVMDKEFQLLCGGLTLGLCRKLTPCVYCPDNPIRHRERLNSPLRTSFAFLTWKHMTGPCSFPDQPSAMQNWIRGFVLFVTSASSEASTYSPTIVRQCFSTLKRRPVTISQGKNSLLIPSPPIGRLSIMIAT